MSNHIIPFSAGSKLPAYLASGSANVDVNKDIVTTPPFPSISIKGKRFTIVRDGVKQTIMKPEPNEDEVAQFIELSVIRANPKAKVFYLKKYDPETSEGVVPDCYSMDGVAPSPNSASKQAEKCALCPQNVWGSRDGKGRNCNDQIRMAVAAPDKMDDPFLLRVPPASIKNFRDTVKLAKSRNLPYTALVLRIGFDVEAESPKLTFKPIGLLSDDSYAQSTAQYDSDKVHAIVGVADEGPAAVAPAAEPAVDADELDAAIAARGAVKAAAAKPAAKKVEVDADELDAIVGISKPAAEPEPTPAPKPAKPRKPAAEAAPAPKPEPAQAAGGADDLLSGLDDMMRSFDD